MLQRNRILAGIIAIVMMLTFAACSFDTDIDISDDPVTSSEVSSEPTGDPIESDEPDEPEVQLAAIKEPPEDADVVLLAEDAYLTSDDHMLLEPDSPPYNIGGWRHPGSAVWMDVEIPADGRYEIGLYYSRAYTEATIDGTLEFQRGSDEIRKRSFSVSAPTSEDEGDWSVYTYKAIIEDCQMDAGQYTFGIYPGSEENAMPDDECFINLRSVMITSILEYYQDEDGDFSNFTQEQRLEILNYEAMDIGNPWLAYSSDVIYAFLAWYANDQYGLSITGADAETAFVEIGEKVYAEYDEDDLTPLAGKSLFYRLCLYYELYPTQEMRENGVLCLDNTYLEFGEEPLRAKGDTDDIPGEYYQNPN